MTPIQLAGCAILEGDTILLLYRIKSNWYEMPGGKREVGESLEDTARRELHEEVGCNVTIIRKLGQDSFSEKGKGYEYHWFLAEIPKNQRPTVQEPTIFSKMEYVPLSKLGEYSLSNNMRQFQLYWMKKN
jgi:8-oxo-dGTP diphosphatase